jgi:hypothetical protein
MDKFWAGQAFAVDERTFTWRDVATAAVLRGDWAALEDRLRRGLALVRRAAQEGNGVSEKELEAAAQEFRYERDLVAAEEMEAWLEGAGLSVEDWMGFIERELLRARGDRPDADLTDLGPEDQEVSDGILAEAVCSGALSRFAETLAGHAALAHASAPDEKGPPAPSPRDVERALAEVSGAMARSGPPDLSPPEAERIAELARLSLVFENASRRLATPPAIRGVIEDRGLDWIRIDVRDLGFEREAAAREALLCLREDGHSLETVAVTAHTAPIDSRLYLEDVDPAARSELLGAGPGDLVGPLRLGETFHLLLVRDKALPSEKDPEVRRRAESYLRRSAVEQEIQARVRWVRRI